MRLSLDDVKKTVTRRGGQPFLIPYVLRRGELSDALDALIALHDAWCGRSRATFPLDRPAELVGDYRLSRGLVACLAEWYTWRAPTWPGNAHPEEAAALDAAGITSPSMLRLALYDYVNDTASGFLLESQRESALTAFAASLGIARGTLDDLLGLDADDRAILERSDAAAPSAWQLAARYNQRVVEAVLANAASVEWVLTPEAAHGSGGGLGTIVKRICFLARRMGVQYDVTFLPDVADSGATRVSLELRVAERAAPYAVTPAPALQTLNNSNRTIVVTLFGPQEVTGAPNQYGVRLARLCRALLGYRRGAGDAERRANLAALASRGLHGTAQVYLHGRPVTFPLEPKLLRLMQVSSAQGADPFAIDASEATTAFDSDLERRLHADFAALERAGEAQGWRLEREPEPVLANDTILVPDFALTRGRQRVYLEIAGYWRPGYRERKARKLAALRGTVALVVAAPESARAEFAGLRDDFPLLWYANAVSAHALLTVLQRRYDDLEQRFATLDVASVAREVTLRGCVPPTESLALLHIYSRNEIGAALARVGDAQGIRWLDAVGLCAEVWLTATLAHVHEWVCAAPGERITFAALQERISAEVPAIARSGAGAVETLAGLAGLHIVRASLFEADVVTAAALLAQSIAAPATPPAQETRGRRAQPRVATRRKQQQNHEGTAFATSSFFSSEQSGGDTGPPET